MINNELSAINLEDDISRLDFIKKYYTINLITNNAYRTEYILTPVNTKKVKDVDIKKLTQLFKAHFKGVWGEHVEFFSNCVKIVKYND